MKMNSFKEPEATGWANYSCVCETACGTFDIPKNWARCPGLYISFDDNDKCPLDLTFIDTGKVSYIGTLNS